MPTPLTQLVYLSPHLDDAALSCGGLIHQQACRGHRPLVITCLAGVPDYAKLSPFAADMHRRWGQPVDPVAARRCEDAVAMAYMGAEYQHWDYLDCIYRRGPGGATFLYASEAALFGPILHEELSLIRGLVTRLAASFSRRTTRIYAPLLGKHIDHQIVLQAALELRSMGFSVRFYSDYPYAEDPDALEHVLTEWAAPPVARLVTLTPENLKARIGAILQYRSQLDVLFGGEIHVQGRVTAYACSLGRGRAPKEKYWQGGKL